MGHAARRRRRVVGLRQDDSRDGDGPRAPSISRPSRSTEGRSSPAAWTGRTSRSRTSSRRWERTRREALRGRTLRRSRPVPAPARAHAGGQFTANTMATALTFLGISPDGHETTCGDRPREGRGRARRWPARHAAPRRRPHALEDPHGARPSKTRSRPVAATGGSTNAVLHLLAIAREAGVPLVLDDFDAISARTPLFVDLKPGGRFTAPDLSRAGGSRLIAKRLSDAGFLKDAITVTGRSIHAEAGDARETPGQQSCMRSGIRSRNRAGLRSCAERSRPRGAS